MEVAGDVADKVGRVHVHTIRAMELEAHRTRASMQLLREQLEESYEEIATLHGKNHRLKVELEEARAKLELEAKLKKSQTELRVKAEQKLELAELEFVRVAALAADVHMERDGARRNNTDLAEEVTRLQQEIHRLNAKLNEAGNQTRAKEQEKAGIQSKNTELERYSRVLEDAQNLIMAERERWQMADAEREMQVTQYRAAVAGRLADANAKCLQLMGQVATLERLVPLAKRQCDDRR